MRRLLLVALCLLSTVACSPSHSTVAKKHVTPATLVSPAPSQCPEAFVQAVTSLTIVITGAYVCADASEQLALQTSGISTDDDLHGVAIASGLSSYRVVDREANVDIYIVSGPSATFVMTLWLDSAGLISSIGVSQAPSN